MLSNTKNDKSVKFRSQSGNEKSSLKGISCKQRYVGLLIAWILFLFLFPQISLSLVLINLFIMILVSALQLYSAMLPRLRFIPRKIEKEPFVSIHIPTYNEPPELVLQSLEALRSLDYKNYEVIVLDNNTKDPEIWKPLEKRCRELGNRFKFSHLDNVEGYKAGALNICSSMSNEATEFILVIDADYIVQPDLLKEAIGHFSEENIALVQFPQSYINTNKANQGMHGEYDHFFEVYMNMANHFDCVLSTGTVSVIRKRALQEVGGWSGSTITEDCELGLRFHQAGFRGVYVPKPLGKGLMPTDLHDLKVQRERWVFGNMQTLGSFFKLGKEKLNLSQCAGIITQLTAWFNFLLIPIAGAFSGAIGMLFSALPVFHNLLLFSLLSIWTFLVSKFIFFSVAFRNRNKSFSSALDAYLVHLGMAWEGALSWIRCLCGENIRFKRTNKFLSLGKGKDLWANLSFSLVLLFSGTIALVQGYYLEWILAWIASPAFASVYFLRRLTTRTYHLTQRLQGVEAA